VGVHFPGDVIFGGTLGYLIAIITITFYSKFVLNKNRKKLIG
jgi:membrane-associated phospholipid phosphatase